MKYMSLTKKQLAWRLSEAEKALSDAATRGLPVVGSMAWAFGDRKWTNVTPFGASQDWQNGALFWISAGSDSLPAVVCVASVRAGDELVLVRKAGAS